MDSPASQKSLLDCHVHLAAFPDGDNGCFISPKMLRSPLFRFLLWKHGLSAAHAAQSNTKYVEDLLSELRASEHVGRAVLLGMDGAYDASGTLDRERTDLLVSNDYVLQVATRYPDELLAGVSINPQRRDAVAEVARCAEAGAALVKVLPNAQGFDPGSSGYIPFYRALARHRLPPLSHGGYEFSLIGNPTPQSRLMEPSRGGALSPSDCRGTHHCRSAARRHSDQHRGALPQHRRPGYSSTETPPRSLRRRATSHRFGLFPRRQEIRFRLRCEYVGYHCVLRTGLSNLRECLLALRQNVECLHHCTR